VRVVFLETRLVKMLEEPSREMRLEAEGDEEADRSLLAVEGALEVSSTAMRRCSTATKIQILSVRELLEEGKKPALPPYVLPTYQQAAAVRKASGQQQDLFVIFRSGLHQCRKASALNRHGVRLDDDGR